MLEKNIYIRTHIVLVYRFRGQQRAVGSIRMGLGLGKLMETGQNIF